MAPSAGRRRGSRAVVARPLGLRPSGPGRNYNQWPAAADITDLISRRKPYIGAIGLVYQCYLWLCPQLPLGPYLGRRANICR